MSIEELYPYERDIYVGLLQEMMKSVEERPALDETAFKKVLEERHTKKVRKK